MATSKEKSQQYPRLLMDYIEPADPSDQNQINFNENNQTSNLYAIRTPTPGYTQQNTQFDWTLPNDLDKLEESVEMDQEIDLTSHLAAGGAASSSQSTSNLADIMSKPFVPSNDPESIKYRPINKQVPGEKANTSVKSAYNGNNGNGGLSNPPNPSPKKRKFKLDTIAECEYVLPLFYRGFRPRPNQTFLFNILFDFRSGKEPEPYPEPKNSIDCWDDSHVKLPNSKRNQRKAPPGFFTKGSFSMVSTWKIIEKSLKKKFSSFKELDEAIKRYNNYENFKFDVLREFIEKSNDPNIFEILNGMAKLATKLPDLITQSLPLLKQKRNQTVFMTQKQIGCLLANAFFCTFPRRSRKNDEYKDYPLFNFVSLFSSKNDPSERRIKIEKLKCIFNYFQRVQKEKPKGVVTFERRFLDRAPDWLKSTKPLRKLQVEESGSIEREGREYSEIEFANRFIGGGVIKSGTLQEEIRLLISPELIVSRLFTEALLDNEALIISGTTQFNILQGYGNSFTWIGDMRDQPNKDVWNRHYTQIIAIDAHEFQSRDDPKQFEKQFIDRALNKAFCGFRTENMYKNNKNPAIASGKWGCGGFNGDPYLSCLIQFMAASAADRDLMLFLKNRRDLTDKLGYLNDLCYEKRLKIKDLYNVLLSFHYESQTVKHNTNIVDFICKKVI